MLYIISILSLLLDGILTNYLPYLVNDLTLFTPLLTVVLIFIIYPFFYKNNKNYLIYLFILGTIYDLFYTNLLFFNGIIFTLLGFITLSIYKTFEITKLRLIFYIIFIICLYECSFAFFIKIFNLVPISLEKLIYKIDHSIILNVFYGMIMYFIIEKITKNKKNSKLYNFKSKLR